ncbi:hypothetical protein T05_15335, partial [Trichinella murrelli]
LDKEDLGTETDEMESLGREMLEIRCIAEDLLKGNAEERLKDVPKNMSDVIFNVRLPQFKLQTATTHQTENRVVHVRLRDDGQAYQLFFTLNKKMSEKICPALCRRSRLVVTPMSTQKTGKDALATKRKNNSERIDLEALCVPTICGVPAKPELNAWQH